MLYRRALVSTPTLIQVFRNTTYSYSRSFNAVINLLYVYMIGVISEILCQYKYILL